MPKPQGPKGPWVRNQWGILAPPRGNTLPSSGGSSGVIGGASGAGIRIEGFEQTMNALRQLAPELYKQMAAMIRAELRKVASGAASKRGASVYGTRFKVNSQVARGSVFVRGAQKLTSRTTISGGEVSVRTSGKTYRGLSPNAKAAAFEFWGHNQPGKTPQARATTAALNAKYGTPGRFLWSTWDELGGNAAFEAKMREVAQDAEGFVQGIIDSTDVVSRRSA